MRTELFTLSLLTDPRRRARIDLAEARSRRPSPVRRDHAPGGEDEPFRGRFVLLVCRTPPTQQAPGVSPRGLSRKLTARADRRLMNRVGNAPTGLSYRRLPPGARGFRQSEIHGLGQPIDGPEREAAFTREEPGDHRPVDPRQLGDRRGGQAPGLDDHPELLGEVEPPRR